MQKMRSEEKSDPSKTETSAMFPNFILSIAANLATDLLKWAGEEMFVKRRIGAILRVRLGRLDKATEDQYRKIVTEAYAGYFHNHPERQLQVIYEFFRTDLVSRRLYEYVFNGLPIDYVLLENELRDQIGNDYILWRILERENLTIEKLIADFFSTYEERELSVIGISTLRLTRRLAAMEERLAELIRSRQGDSSPSPTLLELEFPPLTPGFVARKAEFKEYQQRLKKKGIAIIEGMAGVGKTWLGAKVAKRQKGVSCFWFTFRPRLRDTLETLLWELGIFLAIHEEAGLWQMLQDQRPYPLNVKVAQLVHDLVKQPFLLCFDDFQVVHDNQQIYSFFSELTSRLATIKSHNVKIIIIGFEKPKFMGDDDGSSLQGLTRQEMEAWLARTPLKIPKSLNKELWKKTSGNAKLVSLFVQWGTSHRRSLTQLRDFIVHLPERNEVAEYLLTRVSETLTQNEQNVMQSLAQFREPVSAKVVACVVDVYGLKSLLRHMVRRHLLEVKTGGKYFLHSILMGYYRMTYDLYDLDVFHERAAKCMEKEGEIIEAAFHYIKASLPEKAIEIIKVHISLLVNVGRAQSAIELLDQINVSTLAPRWQGDVDLARGRAHRMLGKFEASAEEFEQAIERYRNLDDKGQQAESLCGLAETRRMQGNYEAALSAYRLAAEISKDLGDFKQQGIALNGVGRVLRLTSNYLSALEVYDQASAVYQIYIDEEGQAEATWGRARTLMMLGQHRTALEGFGEVEEIALRRNDTYRQAEALFGLAEVHRIFGQYDEAISICKKGVVLIDKVGSPYGRAWLFIALGEAYRLKEEHDQAIQVYKKAQEICDAIGDRYGLATSTLGLAEVARMTLDFDKALSLGTESLDVAKSISHRLEAAHASLSILECKRLTDNETLEEYETLTRAYDDLKCQWGVIHCLVGQALAELKRNNDPSQILERASLLITPKDWPIEYALIQKISAERNGRYIHLLNFP